MSKARIRPKHLQIKINQNGQKRTPPPCKASIPPSQTNTLSSHQMNAYTTSNANEITSTEYHDRMKTSLNNDDQNQTNLSDLE